MNHKPVLSIIIATFNSESTLSKVLDSIKKQTFRLSNIEILIIDGGSTDQTLKIARSYRCTIIKNPKTLPSWAKYIGYMRAHGSYAMFLDSDEVIESKRSLEKKINVFLKNPSVHAVTGSGYKSPIKYSVLNDYVNEFGDPFSFFIYRLSKDCRFFIESMVRRYNVVIENTDYIIFNFSDALSLPIFELAAMGSVVDLDYLKKNFPMVETMPGMVWHFFNLLISKGTNIAITKDDALIHYSVTSLGHYMGKIYSRVVTNIYTPAKEGFKGRDELSQNTFHVKQYLFIPYAFSVVLPLIDALYLSLTRHKVGYLLHMPLSIYTAGSILYYSLLKIIGYRPKLRTYGGGMTLGEIQ